MYWDEGTRPKQYSRLHYDAGTILSSLGMMYKNGLAGLAVDYVRARELCLEAAEQKAYLKRPTNEVIPNLGVAEAENFIGMSYQIGMGVAKVYYFENFRISLTYA